MGDYKIAYLNAREENDLETVTIPYGLIVSNTDEPTKIKVHQKHYLTT